MKAPGEHPAWLDPLYAGAAFAFGRAAGVRGWLYDHRLRPTVQVGRPVLSVGNLMVGGTGKTPLVILLAQRLSPRRVGVLSRGYGRRGKVAPLVVSRGEGPLVSAEEGGDEPCLIAQRTPAIVVVDPDRVRGAERAIELGAELLLLDDGFQHRRLFRDLDLVVVDGASPFGNGHLLPRGPLREPPEALSRADLIVQIGPGAAVADPARTVEVEVVPTTVGPHPAAWLAGRRVGLWSGIGRPARFRATVEALGAAVVWVEAAADHAFAQAGTLSAFVARARAQGAELCLCTEKDQARQGLPEGMLALGIELRVVRGAPQLEQALARVIGGAQ